MKISRKSDIAIGVAIILMQLATYLYIYSLNQTTSSQAIRAVGWILVGASFIVPEPTRRNQRYSSKSILTALAIGCFFGAFL